MVIHHPKSPSTIVYPPVGMNGVASPQLVAVTLVGGGTALVQRSSIYRQARAAVVQLAGRATAYTKRTAVGGAAGAAARGRPVQGVRG